VAAHEDAGALAERLREGFPRFRVADEHVALFADLADIEDRRAAPEEGSHVVHGLELALGHSEGHHGFRVAVHDRHHIGPRPVDLAVDEALEVGAAVVAHRLAVGPVEHHVCRGDEWGRNGPRHEEMARLVGRAHAHVAVGIEHALHGEDAVGGDEVFDHARYSSRKPSPQRLTWPTDGDGKCIVQHTVSVSQ
jgi:hypothetical protein